MNEEEVERPGRVVGDQATAVTTAPPPPPPPIAGEVIGQPLKGAKPRPQAPFVRQEKPVATWVDVGLVVVAGFLFNIALRVGFATITAIVGFALLAGLLVFSGRALRREALLLIGLAMILVPWLGIRTDVELTFVTVSMVALLLSLAAGLSLQGSLFDSRVRELANHLVSMPFEWFYGLAMVKRLAKATSSDKQGVALLRGLAVAFPVLVVFTVLLASADEVFAQFLLLGNIGGVFGHLILTAVAALGALSVLGRRAHETAPVEGLTNLRKLGRIEVKIVLMSVVVLFSAFVATQVVVAFGGANHVLETEGLTQADHARRGFFQLLAVAGLSMALVGLVRAGRLIDSDDETRTPVDRFTPLALMTLALTLVIAGVSVQRLLLYVGSFGLTPDRLWAIIAAGAIGIAIVLYAISIAGYRSGQSWYPAVALILGFVVVLGLNVLNPDATIARYNISQFGDSAELDVRSLANLSNDATSTIVSRLGDVQNEQVRLAELLCGEWDRETSYGPLEYNRAAVGSDRALDGLCGDRTRLSGRD